MIQIFFAFLKVSSKKGNTKGFKFKLVSSVDNLSYQIRVIICQNDNEASKYADLSNNKRRDQRV